MHESGRRRHAKRALAILAGALMLCWPAIYNRYPLLFPDSLSYIGDGGGVARAVFMHRFVHEYGIRSLVYALGIFPFHWRGNPWPIIGLHALLTASMLWLVVRSVTPRRIVPVYLAITAVLAVVTSASWYASLIMPDILGPLLYLGIFLLVFARETLSRRERLVVALVACWAVASHVTHLMLGAMICAALLLLLARSSFRRHARGVAEVLAILVIATAAQIVLNAYLYGQPTLDVRRPPYLMARVLADGPARVYLQQHCPALHWVLCDHVANLPHNDDDFLWSDSSIWSISSPAQQQQLRREEMPLVLATIRAYPREQVARSLDNAWLQLTNFDVNDFDADPWVESAIDDPLPGASAHYALSREAHSALPEALFSNIHFWAVVLSLPVIAIMLLWRRNPRLIALTAIVIPTIVCNAALTGILSDVDGRYQSRVVWLIPLLALLAIASVIDRQPQPPRTASKLDTWSSCSTTTTASPTTSSSTWASWARRSSSSATTRSRPKKSSP